MCILLGCDYLEPIKGVGPKTALKLIREHGGLAGVLEHLQSKQYISLSPHSGHTLICLPQGLDEEGW
jgi:5'-3' exonuclease